MTSSPSPSDDYSSSDEESFELIDDVSPAENEVNVQQGLDEVIAAAKVAAVNEALKEWNESVEEHKRARVKERVKLKGRISALVKELDETKKMYHLWHEYYQKKNIEKNRAFDELLGEIMQLNKTNGALIVENEEKTKKIARLEKAIEETKENELDGKMKELSINKTNLRSEKTEVKENVDSIRTVTIHRGTDGKIGMETLMSSIDNVFLDSPAQLSGVRRGDEIVAIDGVKVSTLTSEEMLDALFDSGSDSITLDLQYNPELLELVLHIESLEGEAVRTVTLCRGNDGMFGLNWFGSSIYTVHDGSPAHKNGVKMGDQIISIDGVEVETLMSEEIAMLFKSAAESITLVLKYNPERIQKRAAAQEKLIEMGLEVEKFVTLCPGEDGLFGLSHIGTSISSVKENSPASNGGVKRGDQIVSINGMNVETLSEDEISGMFVKGRETGKISLVLRHNLERLIDLERAWNHRK